MEEAPHLLGASFQGPRSLQVEDTSEAVLAPWGCSNSTTNGGLKTTDLCSRPVLGPESELGTQGAVLPLGALSGGSSLFTQLLVASGTLGLWLRLWHLPVRSHSVSVSACLLPFLQGRQALHAGVHLEATTVSSLDP